MFVDEHFIVQYLLSGDVKGGNGVRTLKSFAQAIIIVFISLVCLDSMRRYEGFKKRVFR